MPVKPADASAPPPEPTEAQDIKRLRAWQDLVRMDGWKYYQELLNAKIVERTATLFGPIEDGQQLASEHNKGAVYGMIWSRDILGVTIAAAKESKSNPAGGNDE